MSPPSTSAGLRATHFVAAGEPKAVETVVLARMPAGALGDNPASGHPVEIKRQEGHAHIHRCGPKFQHRVSASSAPRYPFIVRFNFP